MMEPGHRTLELGDFVADQIVVPRPADAVKASEFSLANPTQAIKATTGGVISIVFTFLLAMFPSIYHFEKVQKLISNTRSGTIPWFEGTAVTPPDVINKIIKGAFSLLYWIVRKPSTSGANQITRSFNALYTTIIPGKRVPIIDLDILLDFKETARWLALVGLDVKIMSHLLELSKSPDLTPTAKAFLGQFKMFTSYAEMTPYLTMREFIQGGLSHAAGLPGVGSDISKFKKAEAELKRQYGDEYFPFLKILRLPGSERLEAAKYPNLLKVANMRKRRLDPAFKYYKNSKEALSSLHDRDIEDALSEPPLKMCGVAPKDKHGLITTRKPAAESTQDILTILIATLSRQGQV